MITIIKHVKDKIDDTCIILLIRQMVKVIEKKTMTTSILIRRKYIVRR
jgi:hypothetical protein